MRTSAHIIKVTVLGTVGFQVNVIDPITGKYYNGQSKRSIQTVRNEEGGSYFRRAKQLDY